MIRFLENLVISVERNLKNTQVAFRIYTTIFIFCFVAFGLLGIVPLSKVILEKIQISRDMDSAYRVMQTNLDIAQQAAIDLNANKSSIALLDRYMPIDTNVQTYMLDFIDSIGSSGFALKYFNQNNPDSTPGRVEMSISLEGTVYPTDMIKNVEMLKRVTQVTRLNMYQNSKGVFTITLDLNIFTLSL